MPKNQPTLASFFGPAAAKASSAKANTAASVKKPPSKNDNNDNPKEKKTKKRVLEDDEDDYDNTSPTPSPATTTASSSEKENKKRRRRVIEDDDESDEEEEATKATAKNAKDDKKKEEGKETKKKKSDDSMEVDPPEVPKTNKEASKDSTKTTTKATSSSSAAANSFFAVKASPTRPKKKQSQPSNTTNKASSPKRNASPKPIADDKLTLPPVSALVKAAPKGTFASDQKILDSIDKELWPSDTPSLPYKALCHVLGQIEGTTKRLQIQELLTTLLRQVLLRQYGPDHTSKDDNDGTPRSRDLYAVLYLASNEVAPAYQCVELGIGDAILIKAIGEATGTEPKMVKQKYESVGDLGTVAMSCKNKQKTLGGFFGSSKKNNNTTTSGLTVQAVLQVFREIAEVKGSSAQKLKVDKIKKLLVKASQGTEETKYIIRGLQGKLRIGLAESTVLISLAHALALTQVVVPVAGAKHMEEDDDDDNGDEEKLPEEAKLYTDTSQAVEKRLEGAVAIIKKAYSEVPSYDAILDAALTVPLERMHQECTLQPGIPVAPMLAKPTKSIQEVLKRLNGVRFTCEYKYDGERAQVHLLPDGTTKVFSRNLLDTSEKYPEVPIFVKEGVKDSEKVQSFVMDAEVVAFNQKTGQLVPFQILSTRKKTQEAGEEAKVKIIVQAFDLMYLNGESLLRSTLSERRQLLQKHFQSVEGKFQFAKSLDHKEDGDTTVVEEFLDAAVKGQCEGLMVKSLDVNAIYEPSKRSLNWLKLKKDYLEGLGDSVDLVPLGAYHGRGKRTGFYGAYLLACYDPDSEEFQSVCKIGTGFSDEDLKTLAEELNKHTIPAKTGQYNVTDQLECDVWFDTVQVWEVKAADLSKSSAHRGAAGKTDRGIGLRFPRFERVRDDKKPVEATTSDQILEMYYAQDTVAGGGGDEDDDGI